MKTIAVKITHAWWFKIYMELLFVFCFLFRTEPNEEKIMYWLSKAIKFEAVLIDIDESKVAEQPPDNLH